MERKIKEMLISLDLTKKYTKEQIMEFYINDISFANTYYGFRRLQEVILARMRMNCP